MFSVKPVLEKSYGNLIKPVVVIKVLLQQVLGIDLEEGNTLNTMRSEAHIMGLFRFKGC